MAAAAVIAFASLWSVRRFRATALPSFIKGGGDRITGREGPDDADLAAQDSAEPALEAQRRPARRAEEHIEWTGVDAEAEREIRVGGPGGAEDITPAYAHFGDHVSSIVQAASEAAKKIEDEARTNAERLRERTQRQAASTLDDARREAEKQLAEAERLRTEAETESKATRERAETYAAEMLRDAEAEAAGVVTRAEQGARARATAAEERSRALDPNVELAEKRLQQLATGLFDTALRLEGLIERRMDHAAGEESASEPTGSLDEALASSLTRSELK